MVVRTVQLTQSSLGYSTGWYRDPNTEQYYYYDATVKQWYTYAAGYLYPLHVPKEAAPKVVTVAPGDTLRFEYSYKYMGPAITSTKVEERVSVGTIHEVLGVQVYDEKAYRSKSRALSESAVPKEYLGSQDLAVPAIAEASWDTIEAKVTASGVDGDEELGMCYVGAINLVGVVPEVTDFAIESWGKKDGILGREQIQVSPGDIVQVKVTFSYTVSKDVTEELWVSLYIPPGRDKTVKVEVSLGQSITPKEQSITVEIPISADDPQLGNDTYDLWAELRGIDEDKVDDAVVITGMPKMLDVLELVPMVMMVMMMSVMMGIME